MAAGRLCILLYIKILKISNHTLYSQRTKFKRENHIKINFNLEFTAAKGTVQYVNMKT